MTGDQDSWFPSGEHEDEWGTFACERTVLAIARTVTSTGRLLEAVRLFRGDFRVNVIFTVNDTSPFSTGARALLRAAGVRRIVPWEKVRHVPHHLAIAASENIDFTVSPAPTVVLPHGLGFNKYIPVPGSHEVRLAGLPPAGALRTRRVRVVLTHPDQVDQLRAVAPEVAGHTVVTGDPTYDQLIASRPLAERYRRALGTGDRRLVLLSSTWHHGSQLGAWRTLPEELTRALPTDEYQVAAVLHPNIWDWYGELQVRTWLAAALDAGLVLLQPTRGWQAALLAADQVIGDHGSITLYAAALGKPVQLAAFGDDEVVPGTPIEALGDTAPHLTPGTDLRSQVDGVFHSHDPQRFEPLRNNTFAFVGTATTLLRDALYREMDLSPPPEPPMVARIADPRFERRPVTAFDTFTQFTDPATLRLTRHPRAARPADVPMTGGHRHLAVDEDESDLHLPANASVLTRRMLLADAMTWPERALREYPGARVAAASTVDGCIARLRDGRGAEVRTTTAGVDPMLLASTVYACVLARRPLEGHLTMRAGNTTAELTLRVVP